MIDHSEIKNNEIFSKNDLVKLTIVVPLNLARY